MSPGLVERFRVVRDRLHRAAERAQRDPAEIALVAAAKGFDETAIRQLGDAGGTDVGESYVQEARRKQVALASVPICHGKRIRWHFIGRLQKNKAKLAVGMFDLIHSLDDVDLAAALDRAAHALGQRIGCLVEINLGDEPSKGGIRPQDLASFLLEITTFRSIDVRGLMTIPPPLGPDDARAYFRRLRRLRDETSGLPPHGVRLKELSMGMSDDFEVAVEEGATMVRVGRAIFGLRR